MEDTTIQQAANEISNAEALVICTGAGMGVDSGLPDFRGDSGFWNAYPMYEDLGINFYDAANPIHFQRDPAFGWGFYGHRTNLYRETEPHAGFAIIKRWGDRLGGNYFVVTSNVDGQFQKAGFPEDAIVEVHGSIHHLQCLSPCGQKIWRNNHKYIIDHTTMRAATLPHCPDCGEVARPNILMFGDFSWISTRTDNQEQRFNRFLIENNGRRLVIVELGAGTAVPTIRHLTETLGRKKNARAIRINPREAEIGSAHISIADGALSALRAIDALL